MRFITNDYVFKKLRSECIPAPLTITKLQKVFKEDEDVINKIFEMYTNGLLGEYHMIPGNGRLEF